MHPLFSKMHHLKQFAFGFLPFKKSNISLEEVSEASVLSVFTVSFISVKRLLVCPLEFFLLAGVGTYFLFAFDAQSENLNPLVHDVH